MGQAGRLSAQLNPEGLVAEKAFDRFEEGEQAHWEGERAHWEGDASWTGG